MATVYPQIERAEIVIPIANRLAGSCGFPGWRARSILDALTSDVVIRLDNTERQWNGLDSAFDSIDLKFGALDIPGKSNLELETMVRLQLEAKIRGRAIGSAPR